MKPTLLFSLFALVGATTAQAFVILDDEHIDIGIGYKSTGWDLHIHDETNETEYEPDEALIYLGAAARQSRPSGSAFDFLGVPAGQPIWRIRELPVPGVPYLGIGTEETGDIFETVTESDSRLASLGAPATAEWVRLRLKSFSGPGNFGLWSSSDGGPVVWMDTANGVSSNDLLFVVDNSHQHFNFAFTQTGVYDLTFEASGIIGGQRVSSGDVTYKFGVEAVPEPATMTALAAGLAAMAARRRRQSR